MKTPRAWRSRLATTFRISCATVLGAAVFITLLGWAYLVARTSANSGAWGQVFAPPATRTGHHVDLYAFGSFLGLCLAAGATVAVILWEPRPRRIRWALLVIALYVPAVAVSAVAFASGEPGMPAGVLGGVHGTLLVLGLLLLAILRRLRPFLRFPRALRALAVFAVAFGATMLPVLYAGLPVVGLGAAIAAAVPDGVLTPGWVSLVCAGGALLVTCRIVRSP